MGCPFRGHEDIPGLMGAPSGHPAPDDEQVNTLFVKIGALALRARAVLQVMEG